LLQLLSAAPGQVLQREEIYQRVWGYAMAHGDRSVDVFVRKLRYKLRQQSPDWEYIHTHFGVGYRFEPAGTLGGGGEAAPAVGEPAADQVEEAEKATSSKS
jgi:DNA-binding winged helix-turn-helix (wHTH) protein